MISEKRGLKISSLMTYSWCGKISQYIVFTVQRFKRIKGIAFLFVRKKIHVTSTFPLTRFFVFSWALLSSLKA